MRVLGGWLAECEGRADRQLAASGIGAVLAGALFTSPLPTPTSQSTTGVSD